MKFKGKPDTVILVLTVLIVLLLLYFLYRKFMIESFQTISTEAPLLFTPVSSYNPPYMKPSTASSFVNARNASKSLRPQFGKDTNCKVNIQPFLDRTLEVDLGDVKPHYIPGTTKQDPTYADTLKIIQQFRSVFSSSANNPNCKNTFLELLYFMDDANVFYNTGDYSGQGVFTSLSAFSNMLPCYMNFQSRNENVEIFEKLESIRKAFRNRVDFFSGVFDQKKDNKFLHRLIPEIFMAIIDGDKPRLEYIKSQLINIHLPVNFDVSHPKYGFVKSEQHRFEHTSGYNGYYTIFLMNILFIYQCLGMFAGFEMFESQLRKVVNTLSDPINRKIDKNGKVNRDLIGIYDIKYKKFYKDKAVFSMNPIPVAYANYPKAYVNFLFNPIPFKLINNNDPHDLRKPMDLISFTPINLYNIIKNYNKLCLKNVFNVPQRMTP